MERDKIWFRAKRYGLGWYPISWEGWAVLLICVYLIAREVIRIEIETHPLGDTIIGLFLPIFCIVVLLLAICYKSGEKAEWRWGDKDKK